MASAPPEMSPLGGRIGHTLLGVVDGNPALRGLGVILIDHGRLHVVRQAPANEPSVLVERRPVPVGSPAANPAPRSILPSSDRPALPARPAPRGDGTEVRAAPPPLPPAAPPGLSTPRTSRSDPVKEWADLGLNCVGAYVSWLGVTMLVPATLASGGAALVAARFAVAGAYAGTAQCYVSVRRVRNVMRNRGHINDALDDDPSYRAAMVAADGVSLAGMARSLPEALAGNVLIARVRVGTGEAGRATRNGAAGGRAGGGDAGSRGGGGAGAGGGTARRMVRREELDAASAASAVEITRDVRQRAVDDLGIALGIYASAVGDTGVLNGQWSQWLVEAVVR